MSEHLDQYLGFLEEKRDALHATASYKRNRAAQHIRDADSLEIRIAEMDEELESWKDNTCEDSNPR